MIYQFLYTILRKESRNRTYWLVVVWYLGKQKFAKYTWDITQNICNFTDLHEVYVYPDDWYKQCKIIMCLSIVTWKVYQLSLESWKSYSFIQ